MSEKVITGLINEVEQLEARVKELEGALTICDPCASCRWRIEHHPCEGCHKFDVRNKALRKVPTERDAK